MQNDNTENVIPFGTEGVDLFKNPEKWPKLHRLLGLRLFLSLVILAAVAYVG